MAERSMRIARIFLEAQKVSPDHRGRFLADACGDDTELRQAIEGLFHADGDPQRPFDGASDIGAPASGSEPPSSAISELGVAADRSDALKPPAPRIGSEETVDTSPDARELETRIASPGIPKEIGKYRILSLLGAGGMGAVYEAEQTHPHRIVALKIIRPTAGAESLLRRFEAESRLLARLQHPGIAQIYEAGTAEVNGSMQPYFAMEMIRGQPLDQFANTQRLTAGERLELMARVCDAVHHAHQKGIIHRDLKPANILVVATGPAESSGIGSNLHDSGTHTGTARLYHQDHIGQPKILDFGVARLTDPAATDVTTATIAGQLVGTLAYMSPEQVAANPADIDTRADVYALGVILFQLLTARLPHEVQDRTLHEAARLIRDVDAPRLSRYNRAFRGDIETIVATAMERDTSRRYQSAADFAADLRRHLAIEPIAARPAGLAYRLNRFMRRHKLISSATILTCIGLIAASAYSLQKAFDIEASQVIARQQAETARENAQRARSERDRARASATTTASINSFLTEMLAPSHADAGHMPVQWVVDEAARTVATAFIDAPEIEVGVRESLGLVYTDLSEYAKSGEHYQAARELALDLYGSHDPRYADQLNHLAGVALVDGDFETAAKLAGQAYEIRIAALGPDHVDVARSLLMLASLESHRDRYEDALELIRQAKAIATRNTAPHSRIAAECLYEQAQLQRRRGHLEESEASFRALVGEMEQIHGSDHPAAWRARGQLAITLRRIGKLEEAEQIYRSQLEYARSLYGVRHSDTLLAMGNLAIVLNQLNRFDEATELLREVLRVRIEKFGPDAPRTLIAMSNIGEHLRIIGKPQEALEYLSVAREKQIAKFGADNQDSMQMSHNMAGLYGDLDQRAEAEALYLDVLQRRERILGRDHPDTLSTMNNLAQFFRDCGRVSEAIPLFQEVLDRQKRLYPENHPELLATLNNLAMGLHGSGRSAEAEPLLREVVELTHRRFGEDHLYAIGSLSNLAAALRAQGKLPEAEQRSREAVAGLRRSGSDKLPQAIGILSGLALDLYNSGQWAEAEAVYREMVDLGATMMPPGHPTLAMLKGYLGHCLIKLERYDEAEPLLLEAYPIMLERFHDNGEPTLLMVRRLVELYERTERLDEAQLWQARLPSSTQPATSQPSATNDR